MADGVPGPPPDEDEFPHTVPPVATDDVIHMDVIEMDVVEMDSVDVDLVRHPVRADLSSDTVTVPAGETVDVRVQVLNTADVIETLHVQLVGLMAETLVVSPKEVTLFPDESVQVTLTMGFHRTLPAGVHEGLVVVSGSSGQSAPAELPLRLEVPPEPAATVVAEPPLRKGKRKAAFEVLVSNEGNTPLSLSVHATDADRQLALVLDDSGLNIPVDGSDGVALVARRRRPWFGAPVEHVITVDVQGEAIAQTQEVRFRQVPRLNAGAITVLTLLFIVSLWAFAMYFGVTTALSPTPLTKVIPETFASGVGLADLDPTVVGGSVTGTIVADTTGQPLARVTVEAFDTRGNLVGASATDDDGAFEVSGLLPIRHQLRISREGFQDLWWPSATSADGAETVLVTPENARALDGVTRLRGDAGALGGQVLAGDGDIVPITVEVEAMDLLSPQGVRTTTADATGTWSLSGLPAPATYRVTYRAAGYAFVDVTQPLDAGQQLVVNTTRLPAADGSIAGLVVDRFGNPVGGITVTAERDDLSLEFTTPTTGEVGTFTLIDLETPATYLLTFTGEGFATETRAVRVGPGEQLSGLEVTLAPVTGVVTGKATVTGGSGLGGVTVTVSGAGVVLTTETLTSGTVGSFRVSGLPLPGVYAVTFDREGYARETLQVELARGDAQADVTVVMVSSQGTISGVVRNSDGTPLGAVEIEVSDGETVLTTTTVSDPAADAGTFRLAGLPPGTYTVTARASGYDPVTVIRDVEAGKTTNADITVGGGT